MLLSGAVREKEEIGIRNYELGTSCVVCGGGVVVDKSLWFTVLAALLLPFLHLPVAFCLPYLSK